MKIYHLSHTDLDGYSAQIVTKNYFDDILFFNSNYGREIDEKFDEILLLIEKNKNINPSQKNLVLITDLNLNLLQCENFENRLKALDSKILLLDHHQSGLECAKKFPWYFLDSSRCATLITYDFFSEIFQDDNELKEYVKIVNSVDIWLKDELWFEFGKVCMGIVSSAKEINNVIFSDESREYIFYLLSQALKFWGQEDAHIKLDMEIHSIKKRFFMKDSDDTLSNLVSKYIVKQLSDNRERFEISYFDKKGILTYNIGNTSVIGNDFLVQNSDIDFFIDVTSRKTMSFRANGNIDVSLMAKNLISGGGHKNASGGLFNSFKDAYSYDKIKSQIIELISKKTQKIEKEADNEIAK
ncbi:3'-to-5' oligoribonuclease B [Campylobacter sp. FMV-PI01]|uniref:3'-to-5' oligoribonuclease B n=1 Tax=Campylobacter portucalensis TaxID=2608384 RepID=A0A6L5WIC8_9BACT|nr:3'-to-5' oligoribonuclease B [Campylobacter portucalensis]MSN96970.1 3'-to-5' oligoribonuclease B [Campylobacter portucalensis]